MGNPFEQEIIKVMNKFENKTVLVKLTGLVDSRFEIEGLKYKIEYEIIEIEGNDGNYLDIDIDYVIKMYYGTDEKDYTAIVIILEHNLEIEIQTKEENGKTKKNKVLQNINNEILLEKIYKKNPEYKKKRFLQ